MSSESFALISFFEVPPGQEDDFIAAWGAAGEHLRGRAPGLESSLYGSPASVARYRFVDITRYPSSQAFQEAPAGSDARTAEAPFKSHGAVYRLERQHGGGEHQSSDVLVIDPFRVAPGADSIFLAGWEPACSALREQAGYLDSALYVAISPTAEHRFVELTRWVSAGAYEAALQHEGFLATINMRRSHIFFRSYPGLYEQIR